jgi:hypothetical protein
MFDAEERHTALAMVAPLDGEISLPARGGRADLSLLDHI